MVDVKRENQASGGEPLVEIAGHPASSHREEEEQEKDQKEEPEEKKKKRRKHKSGKLRITHSKVVYSIITRIKKAMRRYKKDKKAGKE